MDASYCLCVLLFGKQIHEPISLQGDTFLWFYPVFLSSCSVMLSRCASRGLVLTPPSDQRKVAQSPRCRLRIADRGNFQPIKRPHLFERLDVSGKNSDTLCKRFIVSRGFQTHE